MPNFNPLAHQAYFSSNIEQNNNGTVKVYKKFGPILPSRHLEEAIEHTGRNTTYATAPLAKIPFSRAPSPERPHLSSGVNVKLGAVGSGSTRRRKNKSKKSRKNKKSRK